MSMICNFKRIPPETFEKIKRNPKLLDSLFSMDFEITPVRLDKETKVLLPIQMQKALEISEILPCCKRKTMLCNYIYDLASDI